MLKIEPYRPCSFTTEKNPPDQFSAAVYCSESTDSRHEINPPVGNDTAAYQAFIDGNIKA